MNNENWMQSYHEQTLARPVCWHFPPIPDTERLTFERLTFERLTRENAERCWAMFIGDDNPFLDEYFTDRAKFEAYIGYLCDDMPRSIKRGGADWIISMNSQDVGVLHLYDLSLENFSDTLQRCTIGFATAAPRRRTGIMREAVPHFVRYVAREMRRPRILAYTERKNTASVALLRSLGFTPCDEDFSSTKNHYFRYIVRFEI